MIPFLLILLSSAVSLTEGILIKKRNSAYDKEGFCFTAIVSFFSMLFCSMVLISRSLAPAIWSSISTTVTLEPTAA